jgi:TorA maturation chaperone TorD
MTVDNISNIDNTQAEGDFSDLIASIEGCSATFKLLSRIYLSEPTDELISDMRQMRFPANTGSEYMDKGYRAIVNYLSHTGAAAQEELAVDYTRVFIGGGIDSYSAAYPFESVHTGRKRLMMQKARDEVLAIYRAYGLEKSGNIKEAEDHIGYELEFMSILADRSVKALQAGNEAEAEGLLYAQQNFMDDHMLNWVGKFTNQMRFFAKTDFYKGVSYLTIGAIKEYAALLEDVLGNKVD